MFDNIGGKIKGLAKVIFCVEAFAAFIAGICIMADGGDELFLFGLLTWVVGPLVAWVSSWFLYGFGQLIENSDLMAEEYKRKNEAHQKTVDKNNERKQKQRQKAANEKVANPDISDDEYIDITCPHCAAELSFTKEQLREMKTLTCPLCEASFSLK